jgi:hypothetical protein
MPRRSARRHATDAAAVIVGTSALTTSTVARATAAAVATAAVALLPALAAAPAGASTPSTSSTTSPTSARPTAGAEYQAALKAARGKSVHFASSATENGTTINVAGDAGTTSGEQTITVRKGSVVEHVHVVRVGAAGYVNGNNAALHNVIGLTPAQSSKYAGHWLSFPASNTALDALISGLLIKDVSSELQMHGPFSYVPNATIGGQAALGIRGIVPSESGQGVRQVLYVPASGAALPMEEVTNPGLPKGSSAIHGIVTFSMWGEKKTPATPRHSVSLLKVVHVPASGSSTGSKG